MIEAKVTTENLVKQFSDSILEPDFIRMANMLDDKGHFDYQNSELETVEGSKDEFIEWIWVQRLLWDLTDVSYDQCMHCKVGAPVILFDNGMFPRRVKDMSERSKTGLMLDIEDGLIKDIKFCYVFVKTENKCMFEIVNNKNND